MHKGNMPSQMGGPCPDEHQGNMPPWMRGPFRDEMWEPGRSMPPWMRDQLQDEMWGPEEDMPPWMRDRFPDEMWGPEGDMPPWMRGPGYNEMCERGGPMPPRMRGPGNNEMRECGGPIPPWRREPFPDNMREHGGPMPPEMRAPFPGERSGGAMPPEMGGPFPGERGRGPMPPEMRGPFPGGRGGGPMPPEMRGPFPGERGRGPVPPEMRSPFPGRRGGGPMSPEMRGAFPGGRGRGPMPPEMRGPFSGGRGGGPMSPEMRGPFPDERSGGPMPPERRGPFPDERSGGPMSPEMRGPFPDERSGGPMPPEMRGPFPDERRGGPMPPEMRGPFPDERRGGHMPPERRGPFPDERSGGPMPPEMRGPFPDERHGGHMPPEMRGPFPDERSGGPMPPEMRGSFPDERSGGPRPPERRGPFPDERSGGPMPPEMRGPFPDERRGGPMPPERRGPFPDERSGGPMPPEMRGPFPDERRGGHMPPEMRGPFPDERSGGPMPPEMRGTFPDERRGGPMPPEMRGPFPDERCGGPMPPEMRGPFPGERGRGSMPSEMRGRFPDERSGGPRPPEMRSPFPDEWGERMEPMPPHVGELSEQRGNAAPQMRGPLPNEMCGPRSNAPSRMSGPNLHDPQSYGPLAEEGEDYRRRPDPFPAIRQKEMEKCGSVHWENDSFPSGKHSSNQLASGKVTRRTTSVQDYYIQEGAARILESFGLSSEDLEELSSYPEDQLKPENMPEILREIRMHKMTRQLPGLPSQETLGGGALCSSPSGPAGSVQPTAALAGPPVPHPAMPPTSSESWRMNSCPTPSMMSDYYGRSPRFYPHTCILCKIECKHSEGWLLHLKTVTHSQSCHQLRQQYPDWNPEDYTFRKRYESDRNANQVRRQRSVSSSPGRSSSSCTMYHSRSRSRSPRDLRGGLPTESGTSKQSAAQYLVMEQPPKKPEMYGKLLKDQGQQEQPKDEAISQELPKTDPQQLAMSSLVEKSVSQAMSLLHSGGAVGGGLPQAVSLPKLPPVQLDPTAISLGLVSMMQMVATQVVQSVLASKEALTGSASSNVEKQEEKQKVVPQTVAPHTGVSKQGEPKRVLICGHSIIVQASQRAESSGLGSQLGLGSMAKIEWLGQPGMSWDQLLPTLTPHLESSPPPDIVVVHLGEEDLGKQMSVSFSLKMREDLAQIREKVPGIGIIWSSMLERRVWQNVEDPKRFSRVRVKLNREVGKAVEAAGGASILHSDIKNTSLHLYQADGVYLSDAGYDVFLRNLQQGLAEFIREHSKKQEEDEGPTMQRAKVDPVASSSAVDLIELDEANVMDVGTDCRLWPAKHRVLICGHNYIYWASRQARTGHFGAHLGLDDLAVVEWLGKRQLRWNGLLPMLLETRQGPPPHILVIHLGGNDLGLVKGKGLILQAIHDMEVIQSSWPGVSILWSAIVPRKVWMGEGDPKTIDRARRKVNRQIQIALAKGLGHFLPHPKIIFERTELFRVDGVHLSEAGNEIFLEDLQQGVKTLLTSLAGHTG